MTIGFLLLAQACASHEAGASSTDTVARSPEAAGGERVCGDAPVFFDVASAELDEASRHRLNGYADCLSNHEIDVVYVSGSADPTGSDDDNHVLARNRARAVADYLHERGCNVDFVIRSFGEHDEPDSEPLWPVERSVDVTAIAQ